MPNYGKKNRVKFEMLLDLLNGAKDEPICKTNLMQKANISYRAYDKLLDYLEYKGFIERIDPPRDQWNKPLDRKHKKFVKTTPKGIDVLDMRPHIMELMNCEA